MTRRVPDGGRTGDGPSDRTGDDDSAGASDDAGTDVAAPSLPDERLPDGFELSSDTVETLFDIPGTGVSVRGRTVIYEDCPLRAAVETASDGRVDQVARFFFATRLEFRPPLPPGIGTGMVLPMVRNQAHNRFVSNLIDRGFEDIEQVRSERAGTSGGAQVRLQKVSGHFPLSAVDRDLPIEGWVGVWHDDDIFVAGGVYPAVSLSTIFDEGDETDEEHGLLTRSSSAYRDDLLGLVRRVE
jgi:hypothetical protein